MKEGEPAEPLRGRWQADPSIDCGPCIPPSAHRHHGLRVSVVFVGVWLGSVLATFAADWSAAHITLLSTGSRASIVIDLDDDTPAAVAIEAVDNQSVAVEIGPVHGRVLSQLLQAPHNSPLVSIVRVRGITQGADGTVITIHVSAKAPVSASVRRAPRRVYIDLEPLASRTAEPKAASGRMSIDRSKPPQTTSVSPSVVRPAPIPSSPATLAATAIPPTAPLPSSLASPVAAAPRPAPVADPTQLTPQPVAPANSTQAMAAAAESLSPVAPRPGPELSKSPEDGSTHTATVPPTPSAPAPTSALSPAPNLDDALDRLQQLVKTPDPTANERFKVDLQSRRAARSAAGSPTADIDPPAGRLDQMVVGAQQERVTADTALAGSDRPALGGGSLEVFRKAMRPVSPGLASIADALSRWSVGSPPANLQGVVASLLPRLRVLKPPAEIASAHAGVCEGLDALAVMWAKAAAEPAPEGTARPVIDRARQAIDEFFRLERDLGATPITSR